MSFAGFRSWLETDYVSPVTSRPLGQDAPSDYTSRLRLLSRLLDVDIENANPAQLDRVADTFAVDERIAGYQSGKAIIDMRVAVRRYAMYRRLESSGSKSEATNAGSRANELATQLGRLGFVLARTRQHTLELQNGDCIVYLKRASSTLPLVIQPDYEAEYSALASLRGVVAPQPFRYYHNSAMPAFPRRVNQGRTAIYYGLDFDVEDYPALQRLVAAVLGRREVVPKGPERAAQNTETTRLQKARVGQGQFRADLFDHWTVCPLSGVTVPDLLRASHIKPWRHSDRHERLDPFNGLLLASPLDALFDKGFISFTDEGRLMVSEKLPETERIAFGITSVAQRLNLRPEHLPYIRHHRDRVFLDRPSGQEGSC